MKYLNKLVLISALLITTSVSFAQDLKIAHVNSAEIMSEMTEVKAADKKLSDYTQQLEMQLQAMYSEYQSKGQEYSQKEATYEDVIKEIKQKEIMDLETRIQSFQTSAQEKIAKKREELYGPIIKKVEDVINNIAEEKDYDYILDTSISAGILFAKDSHDISAEVRTRLGI